MWILVAMKLHYKVPKIYLFPWILFRGFRCSFPICLVPSIIKAIFSLHLTAMPWLPQWVIEQRWSIWRSIVQTWSRAYSGDFFVVVDRRHYHLKVNSILSVPLSHRMVHFFLWSMKVRMTSLGWEEQFFVAGRGYLYNVKCRTLIGIHRFGHDVQTIKFSPDSK